MWAAGRSRCFVALLLAGGGREITAQDCRAAQELVIGNAVAVRASAVQRSTGITPLVGHMFAPASGNLTSKNRSHSRSKVGELERKTKISSKSSAADGEGLLRNPD